MRLTVQRRTATTPVRSGLCEENNRPPPLPPHSRRTIVERAKEDIGRDDGHGEGREEDERVGQEVLPPVFV